MVDVFISYKSEDRSSAELIAHSLEADGLTVWWDPVLQSGQDYQDIIDTNLRNALVVVVLWSPLSVKSRWVRSEATVADRQGALVPVMIRSCERPVAFELVQTADLTRWQGECDAPEWQHFMNDLHAKLATRRGQAASLHPPAPMAVSELEALFWSSIKDSNDASDFKSYLSRYPNGQFIDLARRRLDTRRRFLDRLPQWSKRAVVAAAAVVVLGIAIASLIAHFKPEGDVLTFGTWTLTKAVDESGSDWGNSTLKFTSQERAKDGFRVTGHFEWRLNNVLLGREEFEGRYQPSQARIILEGKRIVPLNKGGELLAPGSFSARLSADGRALVDGSWGTVAGATDPNVRARWEATR